MNSGSKDVPALRRGQHPTTADLRRMRLGYPGYDDRLRSMRAASPARYAAVMAGARTFSDASWCCLKCGGAERYTRNLACRECATKRPATVFRALPGVGSVYTPTSATASEDWQRRHQRVQWLADQRQALSRLGPLQVGAYSLAGGRVLRAGSVALDTEPLMLAVQALLSGDRAESEAAMRPLLKQDRDLALCVRAVATALAGHKPNHQMN